MGYIDQWYCYILYTNFIALCKIGYEIYKLANFNTI